MQILTFGFIIFIFLCSFIDQIITTESLDTPIAFPIFRPPMVPAQRHKTSAEHLQRHSLNDTNTRTEIEEISTNFNNDNTSEPSLEGLLGEAEEEASIITAEEFKEEKENNKNNNNTKQIENNNNTKLVENVEILRNLKNETKIRHFNNSNTNNITHVINTPQFPLFTGMGLEIIENPSNDAETLKIFKGDELNENNKKMHYHQINYFKNNTKLNKKYLNQKFNNNKKEELITTNINNINLLLIPSTTLKTTTKLEEKENKPFLVKQSLPEHFNKNKQILNVSENFGNVSETFNTTRELINNNNNEIRTTEKQEFLEENNTKNIEELNNNSTTTTTSIITTPHFFTEEENIFAFSNNISSSSTLPLQTTTIINFEDFGKLNNGRDELDNGFERVTMHLGNNNNEDISLNTDLPINNGSIIIEKPSQKEETTQQNIIPFNGISFPVQSTEEILTSKITEQQTNNEFISTTIFPIINTLNAPTINKNEVIDHLHQKHQKGLEFPPMGNNLEDLDELTSHRDNTKDKTENNKELIDENNIENRGNEQKENSIDEGNLNGNKDIGESMKRTSKYSTTTSSSDNLRIFVLLSIITILLVTIALGSIFSARYVKRSRQLHGKYQPAAYEMQTQQRENNNYQTSINYSSTQTSLYSKQPTSPQLSSSTNNNKQQQQIINATFGKEERLI